MSPPCPQGWDEFGLASVILSKDVTVEQVRAHWNYMKQLTRGLATRDEWDAASAADRAEFFDRRRGCTYSTQLVYDLHEALRGKTPLVELCTADSPLYRHVELAVIGTEMMERVLAAFDSGEEGAREALRMERTVGAILGEAPAQRARELRDIGRDSRSGTVTLLPNDHWAHGGALTEESASPERSQPRPRGMQRERSREVQHDRSRRARQRSRTRDARTDEYWDWHARDAQWREHQERIRNADGARTQGHAAKTRDGRISRPGRRGLGFERLAGQWGAEAISSVHGTLEPRRAPSAAGGRLDQVRAQVRGPEDWGWSWGSPPRSPRVHAPDVADVPMWRHDRAWKPENRQPPSRGGGWDSASE